MKNKKILITGAIIAAAVWGIAALVFLGENEVQFPSSKTKTTELSPEASVASATPAESEPTENVEFTDFEEPAIGALVETEPAQGTPVSGNQTVRKANIPAKAPRKAIAAFRCKGEICVDATTGKMLAGTNISVKNPPASVIKLMTLYVVFDAISAGTLKLDDTATASLRAQKMGGTQVCLAEGETCVVRDLICALMVESANDAAVALAEKVSGNVEDFVVLMNKKAQELGMKNSAFVTPHGLPPSRKQRAAGIPTDMTTAEDLAKLSVALLTRFPETLEYSSLKVKEFPANAIRQKPLWMKNHNEPLLSNFPGCDGLKTGWTNDGASIVTTASRGNGRVIAVVLGGLVKNKKGEIDPKSSQRERNQRASELMFNGLKAIDVLQYEPTPYKK